jgi:folate-dependent phosphoribosylglycinamide formyltransferase PurN
MSKACCSISGLAREGQELVKPQIVKLDETIQQLQTRIIELEVETVPSTLQEVHDQREETAKNTLIRIRSLTSNANS